MPYVLIICVQQRHISYVFLSISFHKVVQICPWFLGVEVAQHAPTMCFGVM